MRSFLSPLLLLACSILLSAAATPSQKAIAEATRRLDAAIDSGLAKSEQKYNVGLNDHIFVRRIYTDLAGRIPSYDEVRSFTESMEPDKREQLIDTLLQSDDFVSHTYNWYADLLRVKSEIPETKLRTDAFSFWLKQQIKKNRPFDDMVQEMITAEGRIWDNPPAAYHLRDAGMKLDHVSYMSKAFLGTDISCAQCHDAPFHDWTQFEYYELTAFLADLETNENLRKRPAKPRKVKAKGKNGKKGKMEIIPAKKDPKSLFLNRNDIQAYLKKSMEIDTSTPEGEQQLRRATNRFNQAYRDIVEANELVAHTKANAVLKLPETYEYDDAKPGQTIEPRAIFGAETKKTASTDRQRLADWIISRNNPRFSANYGNRIWHRYFGRAIAQPLHDMEPPEDCDNPQLFKAMQEVVVALNYDVRAISRAIISTKAYNTVATTTTVESGAEYYFPGPVLRRMSAEQIWDSLLVLMLEDPHAYRRTAGSDYAEIINFIDEKPANMAQTAKRLQEFRAYKSYSQLVDRSGKPMTEPPAQRPKKGSEEMMSMMVMRDARKKKMALVRASELPQPAPQGHFLRDFGQSNRDFLVDASTLEGSVPQVMELMNGAATSILSSPQSLIFQNMRAAKTPIERAEVVSLSILNRKLLPAERKLMVEELKRGGPALSDMIWALLNTPEFLFIK